MRELGELVRGRRLTRTVLAVLAAAGAALACWALGLGPWHAGTAGAALAGAGLVTAALPSASPLRWHVEAEAGDHGARSELLHLSIALRPSQGTTGRTGLARVQALGRERLQRRGLHLDRAGDLRAIEHLLGREALDVLLSRVDPTPSPRALAHCVARLEALPAARTGGRAL